ncbi:MAG: hypothetical protein MJK04_36995 [Psychrosphaera sp.]|nr:hypothetical protein [Psychrosphaera sp.]
MSIEYIISYLEDEHLVSTEFCGIADANSIEKMYEGCCMVAKKHNCSHVLIDIRKVNLQLQPAQLKQLNADIAQSLLGLSIARVINISNYRHDLTCQVLRNHSVNIHDFEDVDAAKKWLGEQG